jgi:hypothetical protein
LLTVLSGASDGLRRKILGNLSTESVRWLQQNLQYFDEPTRALLSSARNKLLGVANKLLREGAVSLPGQEGDATARTMSEDIEKLGATILALLERLQRDGRNALASVVRAGGDPILEAAIAAIVAGGDENAVTSAMEAAEGIARAAFERRIAVAREGVKALWSGEEADRFRKRLDRIGVPETK